MTATILPFSHVPHHAMMSLHCIVPETAYTAEMLGIERESHAVQISEDGLMLTIGYSVMEASEIWLKNYKGETTEGVVLAQDYDSGIALIRPNSSLGSAFLKTADSTSLSAGDDLSILTSNNKQPMPVVLIGKAEYVGRWEYLLEEALYTAPLCEFWSGAALVNTNNELCGIGSLALGLNKPGEKEVSGNLFIPVELVSPHIENMSLYGQKVGELRPWLGTLLEEYDAELHVIGTYRGAPAEKAGIIPGDVILAVDNEPITSMADFFRIMWRYGPAGSNIPIKLRNAGDKVIETIDRNTFFVQHSSNIFS